MDILLQCCFRFISIGVPNSGVSFGMIDGFGKWTSIAIYIPFIVWLSYLKVKKQVIKMSLIFIALGGLGNLIGRVMVGDVWDYIYLPFLPFWFNLSDLLITVGVVLYLWGEIATSRVRELQ